MVTIETKAYGSVEVDPKQIISFPEGVFAFETYRKFALVTGEKEGAFLWLQSLDETQLAFLVIDPLELIPGYEPVIPGELLKTIEAKTLKEATILCIVTIPPSKPEAMTVNLQGPLLINSDKGLGGQFISADERHLVKTAVLDLLEDGETA